MTMRSHFAYYPSRWNSTSSRRLRSQGAAMLIRFFNWRFYMVCIRRLPFVPPDELWPWLFKNNLVPHGLGMDAEIDHYWTHLASKGVPNTADKPGSGCVPLWLWGDDTRYNEQGAKIVVVAMGAVMDRRTSSKDTVYPIFCYQVDSQLLNMHCAMYGFDTVPIPPMKPRSNRWALRPFRDSCSRSFGQWEFAAKCFPKIRLE